MLLKNDNLGDNFTRALFYSEESAKRSEHGAGVVLVDGKPVLFTEARTNEPYLAASTTPIKAKLESNFNDAVEVYRGKPNGYQLLIGGHGTLRPEGEAYCEQHGIEKTPEALRKAAMKPQFGM